MIPFYDKIQAPAISVINAPVNDTDVVRLQDVSSSESNGLMAAPDHLKLATLAWAPVKVAYLTELAGTSDGNGVITANATEGLPAVDGYTPNLEDRVLVLGQTNKADNGIYIVTNAGMAGMATWVLERTDDADEAQDFTLGKLVRTSEGSTKGAVYRCMSDRIEIEATDIVFGELVLAAEGAVKTFEGPIVGDDVKTEFDVVHNLGTKRVQVAVWDTAGLFTRFGIIRKDENTVTVTSMLPIPAGTTFYVTVNAG